MTTYGIEKIAGDSESIEITVLDEDGAALDLTGASIEYAIKTGPTATANVLLLTTAAGSITIAANVFTITMTPANTASLSGVYYHEAEITLLDGRVFTPFTGYITIDPSGI